MRNLKYKKLQDIFLRLTFLLRGFEAIDLDDTESKAQQLIRYAYAKNSQPFQDIKDGVSYVWVNYAQDPISSLVSSGIEYKSENDKFLATRTQLRRLEVHWIFYGESAQDDAFEARLKIFSQEAKDFLDHYGIELILDVPEVVLLYEQVNNQWWPRVEFTVPYYITTGFEETIDRLVGMDIYLETEKNEYPILIEEDEN